MSFPAKELAVYSGAPVEIYRFYQGANVWRYTSADVPLIYQGETYTPIPIQRTGIDQSNELKAGSIKVTVPRDNPLAGKYIITNPAFAVWLTVYRFHRGDNEVKVQFIGRITNVSFEGAKAVFLVSPLQEIVGRKVPRICYQSVCNHILYSSHCGKNSDDYKVRAQISQVDDTYLTAPIFAQYANGWFNHGFIAFGDEYRMIISHVGNKINLLAPLLNLTVGATISAYAGCDRSRNTCLNKFDNLKNFLAWNYIPSKNPFQTGVL